MRSHSLFSRPHALRQDGQRASHRDRLCAAGKRRSGHGFVSWHADMVRTRLFGCWFDVITQRPHRARAAPEPLPLEGHDAGRRVDAGGPEREYEGGTSAGVNNRTARNPRSADPRPAPRPLQSTPTRPGAVARRSRGLRSTSAPDTTDTGAPRHPTDTCCCADRARIHSGPCGSPRHTGTCSQATRPRDSALA